MTGRRLMVAAVAMVMLASGCSGDDDDGAADDANVAEEETTATEEETTATEEETTATEEETTTTEEETTTTEVDFDTKLTETECGFPAIEGLEGEPRCGTVAVPLDIEDPEGDTIDIAVAVIPAQVEGGGEPAADPVVFLAGGPGQKLVGTPELALSSSASVLQQRDLVLVEQRGIGENSPALDCPEIDAAAADPNVEDEAVVAATQECRDRLTGETDLSAFDTEANVADLDLVRQALDYEQINLYGTSYGARLALQYARDHSDALRSLLLHSPVPAEANFQEEAPENIDAAFAALAEECAADTTCDAVAPDLEALLDEALTAAQAEPEVTIVDAMSGEEITLQVTPEVVANALGQIFYVGPVIGGIPDAILQASEGEFTALVQAGSLTNTPGSSSTGMQLSVLCAEEAPRLDLDDVVTEAQDASTFAGVLAESTIGQLVEQCEVWDVEESSDATYEPVSTDVPTMIVVGQFDQVTPVRYGEAIAEELPESTLVEVGGVGHAPLGSLLDEECRDNLLTTFFDDPSAELPSDCATGAKVKFQPMAEALTALTEPSGG